MNKIFLLLAILVTLFVKAQNIEITPMGGYSFVGTMNFYEGELDIKDNASYGLKIGFSPLENSVLEFSYQGNVSEAEWNPYRDFGSVIRNNDFQMSANYFTINLQQERMLTNEKIYGFGAFGLGMAYMHPLDANIEDLYSFAMNFELGIKIFVTDRIGIRIQGGLQMPLYFEGIGFYAGVGSGGSSGGLSLNSGAYFVQGGFSGGLIFRIGE